MNICRHLLNQKHSMEWFLLRRFVDLVRIYFLLVVSRNHFNRVKYCSDVRILTDLRSCCPLHNVYFNDIEINRWRKDKGHLFTSNLHMSATKIRRISLLRTFFCFLEYICFAPSQMFNVEISWNFDAVVLKIFSGFYPIFHETFSNSCGCALKNLIFF